MVMDLELLQRRAPEWPRQGFLPVVGFGKPRAGSGEQHHSTSTDVGGSILSCCLPPFSQLSLCFDPS